MSFLRRSLASSTARPYVPTASSSLLPSSSSAFSTSAPSSESKARRKSRLTRKAHLEKKETLTRTHALASPDPVRGYARGKEAVWEQSLLKSVLLDRAQVWGETVRVVPGETSGGIAAAAEAEAPEMEQGNFVPDHFNFGLSRDDALDLAGRLPFVSMQRATFGKEALLDDSINSSAAEKAMSVEQEKMERLVRIVDLRNASSKGIEVENTKRIVAAFGKAEGDTGSPEVQAAIMTSRIHSLSAHLISQPRDVHNRRPLRSLIQQRAKVLKYLRSLDVKRYEDCLGKIGVEARAVEGEVIVTKTGLRKIIRGA